MIGVQGMVFDFGGLEDPAFFGQPLMDVGKNGASPTKVQLVADAVQLLVDVVKLPFEQDLFDHFRENDGDEVVGVAMDKVGG